MTRQLGNGVVAGLIAGVLALLCWRFLADASWATALWTGIAFFFGTMIVTILVAHFIGAQTRARRR